ncbi:hypothetical protein [uncultured Devosia sp.]|uniref:hypothetical protein n=1 Tax=uncultured Devosia sp. TaxID=211434 RepID=UPI0035CB2BD6
MAMKSNRFASAPNMDERIVVAVPAHVKAKLFETAVERGLSASVLVRQALSQFVQPMV